MADVVFLLVAFIILVGLLAAGILSIINYIKTKKTVYLVLGLILTLFVMGVIVYTLSLYFFRATMVAYGPPDMMQ